MTLQRLDPTHDYGDDDLVVRIGSGDADAFGHLFRRYAPMATAVARRILGHQFLAEETVQEAFLDLWRSPDRFDRQRGSVRSWLMITVHHRAVDLVRREESQRQRALSVERDVLVEEHDVAEGVVEALGIPEERRLVRSALAALPPLQMQVIELMYFVGLSQSMIAAELRLPLGTVKSRTLLGMRRLRAALNDMER